MWPFKRRSVTTESANSEYNRLRKSIGMAPASDDDCAESVAFVVTYDLFAKVVADEAKRHLSKEQAVFMMTYACLLRCIAMRSVESTFPPRSWVVISRMIDREFEKQPWFDRVIAAKIWESLIQIPLGGLKGKHTGTSLGPLMEAILAATAAGYSLSTTPNMECFLAVGMSSSNLVHSIGKLAPVRVE